MTREIVLAFVRGEITWASLTKLGLVRSARGSEVTFAIPASFPVVRPTIADVAAGLISQRPAQRKEWASVLLALDMDFAELEHDERGAVLLEAIWDATQGHVSENALDVARAVSTGSTRAN